MYYKDEKENFTHGNTVEHFGKGNNSKFPMWLLIVIITVIVASGLGLLYFMRHGQKTQKFGFHFY
jgi:hypothetical protein